MNWAFLLYMHNKSNSKPVCRQAYELRFLWEMSFLCPQPTPEIPKFSCSSFGHRLFLAVGIQQWTYENKTTCLYGAKLGMGAAVGHGVEVAWVQMTRGHLTLARTEDLVLGTMGSYWRVLRREMTWHDLHLKRALWLLCEGSRVRNSWRLVLSWEMLTACMKIVAVDTEERLGIYSEERISERLDLGVSRGKGTLRFLA